MRSKIVLGCLLICLFGLDSYAQSRWVHLRVQERNEEESIRVDVPISMLEAMLPRLDLDDLDGEDWNVGGHDSSLNLRELLDAAQDAPDGDFVRIRSRDEKIRVGKEDGFLIAEVDESDGERIRLRIPLAVVDALLTNTDDRVDLAAALESLAYLDGQDLLTVESDDNTIRVWIDNRESGD